jgi:hypothetical protein
MELETDEANLRADSSRIDEIELYNDLIAFSSLSPEERGKELPERIASTARPATQAAGEFVYADLDASSKPAPEPVEERGSQGFELIGPSSFELVDQPVSQTVEEPSAFTVEDIPFETQDEPAPDVERGSSFELLQAEEPRQKKSDYLDLNYLLRVTGPLIAFGMSASEASPLLVCRDCGSQSSIEDMFCVTCGELLDKPEPPNAEPANIELVTLDIANASGAGAAAGEALKLACHDCDCMVEDGEIFCPACGAVL